MAVKLMMRFSRHESVIELRCVDRKTRAVLMNDDGQPLERRIESTRVHKDDEDIASRIQAVIQGFIMQQHPEDNGRTVLPDEEIEVELRAPNVPTIDLVDIPGIVQYPPAAAKATREIATRYLQMEHTLVLCVLSARTQSLRNNAVWSLLRETLEGDRVSRVIAVLSSRWWICLAVTTCWRNA
eukprot:scaffold3224_cov172-Pinguiococcus_pyrenoidosus.AAC.5